MTVLGATERAMVGMMADDMQDFLSNGGNVPTIRHAVQLLMKLHYGPDACMLFVRVAEQARKKIVRESMSVLTTVDEGSGR
jgi:hypothetical protein